MSGSEGTRATELLRAWRGGDEEALDRLLPLLYGELKRLAGHFMGGERPGHTLQPTALVHEAYLRLIGMDVEWQDRAHFLAVAARTMRRLLIDHERGRRRRKRSGGIRVTLAEEHSTDTPAELDLLDLDRALERLGEQDPESARIVELQYFGGLTTQEIGEVVGLSRATVERRVRFAKAWLHRALDAGGAGAAP
ncbi:MAG TPA: ECF-type sigma factor [Thermoanaerobaculia bacterium]|nr:ECF-type sigma factor [Thermoanaerobaculia bacterium]